MNDNKLAQEILDWMQKRAYRGNLLHSNYDAVNIQLANRSRK